MTSAKLDYLWEAARGALLNCDPPKVHTARYFMSKLLDNAAENDIRLEENILESLCQNCNSPLVAGLNCRVRLRRRTSKSPRSLRIIRRKRRSKILALPVKSQLVTTCFLCGFISRRLAYLKQRNMQRAKSASHTQQSLADTFIPLMPLDTRTTYPTHSTSSLHQKSKTDFRLLLDPKKGPRKRRKKGR
mmetsp:Transcript_7596/g.10557  ORF Transcript_7596/g.10557 Transcript_7596/m.10557 type:complete len:189 (+) Transcript_7596:211-777(+)